MDVEIQSNMAFCHVFGSYYVFNMFISIDNAWCIITLGDGHINPYRSIAIHGSISIAFKGNKNSKEEVVNMILLQPNWFVYMVSFFLKTNDA